MRKIKKQKSFSGIHLNFQGVEYGIQKKHIVRLLLSAALFIGLIGSFNSMLEFRYLPQALAIGLAVITVEILLRGRKKALIAVNAVFGLGLIVAIIIWPNVMGDGFRLLINQLFTVSETRQAYKYDMFTVTVSTDFYSRYVLLAFLVATVILAVISALIAGLRKKTPIILIALAVIMAQSYFGVFPSPVWTIYLYLVLALCAACGEHVGVAEVLGHGLTLLLILIVITGIIWAVWPGVDVGLYEFSEHIRDEFDEQIEQPITQIISKENIPSPDQTEDMNLNVQEVSDDPYSQANNNQFDIDHKTEFKGAEVAKADPQIPYNLIFSLLILVFVAVWFGWNEIKAAKRRARFRYPNCAEAINCIFLYTMDWLKAYGLRGDRVLYSMNSEPLSAMISSEYATKYGDIVGVWQEAVYSDHTISEAQRTQALHFLKSTKEIVWKHSGLLGKLKIKLKYFL